MSPSTGTSSSSLSTLWQKLGSLRFTLLLFFILTFGCVLGTLFPQGVGERQLLSQFSPSTVKWITTLQLHDLYHSLWFQALLGLLSLNLIVCTLQRLPKTVALLQHREEFLDPRKLSKFSLSCTLRVPSGLPHARQAVEQVVRSKVGPLNQLHAPQDSFAFVVERGRWTRYMVYVVHLSVLIIFFGALLGSLFGFKGMMNVAEGETNNRVFLSRGHRQVVLPFQVRCDDFHVSYYDTGAPEEFRSDLVILEDGREVLRRSIRVNDPLTYKGVTFYQASYGAILKEAKVQFTDKESGETITLDLAFREPVPFADSGRMMELVDFAEDLSGFGKAVAVVTYREGEQPKGSWILVERPDFHGNRVDRYAVKVLDLNQAHYTGLQVKRDPGVVIVITGFILLLAGLLTTFYTQHRKIFIWAQATNPGTTLILAARSSKKSLAFEREFQHLCERIREHLTNPRKES
ncbi:cytochrome c biogenesis protein [Desulfacinum infernum DSM 9756]|uniref:Cytochrome c biogenesis protein n=1 Tax=Desulfacinum infernum DSM 9756 TaxID=1121391 RepID=A0A1M5CD82_9BACT|nr:cytochrome c biogenesis protein ResB [Desulfacinum infernum]SHF52651.1 cytochrome c biogenesis protein [Desulfacinum infernum DSM 9756]